MMSVAQMPLLEDFGVRGIMAPKQRLAEYKKQCKGLSKRLQAEFWLIVIAKDPEVRKLVSIEKSKGRRRH